MYYLSTGLAERAAYRILDIRKDSLKLTTQLKSETDTVSNANHYDLTFPFSIIKGIAIPKSGKLHNRYYRNTKNYTANFYPKDTVEEIIPQRVHPFTNTDSLQQAIPFATIDGIKDAVIVNRRIRLVENNYEFRDNRAIDSTFKKSWIGVPDVSPVDQINGFSISYRNTPHVFKESLEINGLSITADPFFFPLFMFNAPHRLLESYPDFDYGSQNESTVKINGLYLSTTSIISDPTIMNGLSISLINGNHISNGVQISPLINISQQINGVQISAFRNTAVTARGLQIGLWNNAADLKGIQLGLWNSNQKRSLPFINWNFKD